MKRRIKWVCGYSLLELLIVLSIGSILLSIASVSLQKYYKGREVHFFLEQFKRDLYFTQRTAINDHKVMHLHILPDENRYIIATAMNDLHKNVNYPKQIRFESSTMPLKITYNKSGNISNSGTLIIKTEAGKYKMVFLLGKGRFYAEKF
ncbi:MULTISPECIES: competence type IV pilus minor pilin ComGD [Fictibacillus]|uniref:Competence type IV pilus minor pilin ComGD n=1 Tax=Fictibacillus terranigra TaxID=3058424 RepID=A0ABT8E9Z6_9BACL|nr:competence type IV pilus minor pilin ComGD [Fictibacillus sp. CENA-BCM004]MDN4074732.1 competence type IV pilus minor pilin ComGD [Fictibacillus sp. CENA-BCM004]